MTLAILLKLKGYYEAHTTRTSERACLKVAEELQPGATLLAIGMRHLDGLPPAGCLVSSFGVNMWW